MKANVGGIDRIVRLIAGIALIVAGAMGMLAAPWSYVAMAAGAVFVLTAVIRFCPLYLLYYHIIIRQSYEQGSPDEQGSLNFTGGCKHLYG